MKKIIAMILAIILVAGVSVVGTMAWLQDEDYSRNTMVLGNVDIEVLEYQRVKNEDGSFAEGTEGDDFDADYGITRSYKLEAFEQKKSALPAVYANEKNNVEYDQFQQLWNGIGAPGSNDLFGPSIKNVVDKFVFVKNTGDSDCYFRTIIAIEFPEGIPQKDIHLNTTTNSRYDYNPDADGYIQFKDGGNRNGQFITIDGVRYYVFVTTHTEPLKKDEISRPSLLQVFLDPTLTNEDCAKFGETWDILTLSQAVQSEGFESADVALNAAFGKVTATNVLAWFANIAP